MMLDTHATYSFAQFGANSAPLDTSGWRRLIAGHSRGQGFLMPSGFALMHLELSATPLLAASAQRNATWLALVLDDQAHVDQDDHAIMFQPGDLIQASADRVLKLSAAMRAKENCLARVLLVLLPHDVSHASARCLARVGGPSASATLLAALLRTALASIDSITVEQVRPLELSLAAFFNACVANDQSSTQVSTQVSTQASGASTYRKALLQRACAFAEQRLRDHSASAASIAGDLCVSKRYVQKLFAATGERLSVYLRRRRLEIAHAMLMDPFLAGEGVAEIAYRCGFNDPAYFSRVFRTHFGQPPSQLRQVPGQVESHRGKVAA